VSASAAAPSTVTSGSAAWGYKQSFRSYVGNQTAAIPPTTALPAGQRITLSGGAQFDTSGTPAAGGNDETLPYLFPVTGGSVTDADNLTISAAGIVTFHFPSHCFEARVGDPRVVVSGGVATLRGHLEVTTSNSNPVLCASYDPPSTAGGADVVIGTADHSTTIAGDGSSATVSLTNLELSAAGAEAMQGFASAGDVLDNIAFTVQLEIPEPDAPSLTVSKADRLDPAGESITVTGKNIKTGFANTHGVGEAGVYAQIGYLDADWRPSAGAPAEARSTAYTKWVKESAADERYLAWTDNGDGTADFAWTVTVDKATLDAVARAGATLAVFTVGAGGVVQAVNELAAPISFAGPTPTVTTVTSTPAAPIVGDSVTLKAVVTPTSAGEVAFFTGTTPLGTVPLGAGGSASVSTTALTTGSNSIRAVFTPADPLHIAPSEGALTVTVSPKSVLAAGSLTWGVKESFRSYVTGPIAHGSITTTGLGTSGGAFVFGQASGGTFDGTTGTSKYSGSVRFTGHDGVLDLRLGNPVVRIDSASKGTLLVSVNGGGAVAFASLSLAAGTRTVTDGAVRYSGVPATLLAAGAAAFSYQGNQFYPAGTSLDAVSFVIGAPGSAGSGTRTVAAFVADPPPPTSPPATTGLTIDPAALAGLVAGGEITVAGDGFESNETGIQVVVYSDPIVLAKDLTADASGAATWTGRLPVGLTGKHTLTFQGSVDRGVVVDIPARIQAAGIDGCPASDASLTWGFKESFRSYISGTIANGEWTTADGATYATPDFSWADGVGDYDGTTGKGLLGFTGSIRFTGHGGILDTTVSNPQLRFDDPDHAVLLLDVSGTTQEGEKIDEPGVEFASLDLRGAVTEADGRISISKAPAVLLEAGATAFGTYQAGEEFDPVSAQFAVDASCTEPIASPSEPATPIAQDAGLAWLWWVGGALLLLMILAALGLWLLRRRAA
jgi:hypothetical protein